MTLAAFVHYTPCSFIRGSTLIGYKENGLIKISSSSLTTQSGCWWTMIGNLRCGIATVNYPRSGDKAKCLRTYRKISINDMFKHWIIINLMWASDAIWRHRAWSALAQEMACCLAAPSRYLNQCWLTISRVLWHSPMTDFTKKCSRHASVRKNWFEKKYTFKITSTSPGANELMI